MVDPRDYPLLGHTIGGRYELRDGLGVGGFAEVYKAFDRLDDVLVALKVLRVPTHLSQQAQAEYIRRFEEEAKVVRRQFAGERHVRQVLNLGIEQTSWGPRPWMAMEYLEGEPLQAWLERRRGQPLPVGDVMSLIAPVFEVMAMAHDRGVVHRDIKPGNLFIATDAAGQVLKVLDFGIAKVVEGDDAPSGATMTSSALVMFSPHYGAPEQFASKRTGKYTDVFALGLLMTEMITGQCPLSASGDRSECMMASLDRHVRPTPRAKGVDVDLQVDAVIAKAVAVREADRFADARGFWHALQAAVAGRAGATVYGEPAREVDARTGPAQATQLMRGLPTGVAEAPIAQKARPRAEPKTTKQGGGVGIIIAGLALLGVGVLLVAMRVLREGGPDAPEAAAGQAAASSEDETALVAVSGSDLIWGKQTAPVTWVVFTDLECPFCAKLDTTMSAARARYGADKLRQVLKHLPLPFHKNARPSAKALLTAQRQKGNLRGFDFASELFANRTDLSRDALVSHLSRLGVSHDDAVEGLDDPRFEAHVAGDEALASRLGATGTPTSFINCQRVTGAQPLDKFVELIDAELDELAKSPPSGAGPGGVYAAQCRRNYQAPGKD